MLPLPAQENRKVNFQEMRRTLNTRFARSILKPFNKAVREYGLVRTGDMVAVCVSGGKDSMLLALLMLELQRTVDYGLTVLAMDPGYTSDMRQNLEENAARLGLNLEVFETNVLQVAERHALGHPCFLCSKMRRGYLYAEAQKRGCSKIALGHHYDDAVETVLMGILYGGQLQAMRPRLKAEHYPGMELIRPLVLVREQAVSEWAELCGLYFRSCGCPAKNLEHGTNRERVRNLIGILEAENPQVGANILNTVKNVDTSKLLGWRDDTGKHSFLDAFTE